MTAISFASALAIEPSCQRTRPTIHPWRTAHRETVRSTSGRPQPPSWSRRSEQEVTR